MLIRALNMVYMDLKQFAFWYTLPSLVVIVIFETISYHETIWAYLFNAVESKFINHVLEEVLPFNVLAIRMLVFINLKLDIL